MTAISVNLHLCQLLCYLPDFYIPVDTDAAAMGSISGGHRPPACSALSRTARNSTSVEPEGTPITIRKRVKKWRPVLRLSIRASSVRKR